MRDPFKVVSAVRLPGISTISSQYTSYCRIQLASAPESTKALIFYPTVPKTTSIIILILSLLLLVVRTSNITTGLPLFPSPSLALSTNITYTPPYYN